ncbi:MAG: hypothetical protein AAB176_05325 [Pseudomonadota bacterium]
MSGAEIVCARFVQRVDEFKQPLAVEVLAEADRLTWRLWEPLETFQPNYPVGKVTQKQYQVHSSGASILAAHSLPRRGQSSPFILPVRLDMPSGHTETIEGVQWGLVDEIALDPQAMRAKPRMYGEHLSDWAAWMFVLCTDTWRFMTPFNRHLLTRSSRVDSEGFTALSLSLTKARPLHLVAGSCLVPWHKSPLSAQMVLRINAHPGGPLWTNLQVDEHVTYAKPSDALAGHAHTITRLHEHMPKLTVQAPPVVTTDQWVELEIRASEPADAWLHVHAVSGYVPHQRVRMVAGRAQIRALALGLRAGENLHLQFGLGAVTALAQGVIHVI